MSFRINYGDSKKSILLKLIYLIPYVIIAYIPAVIYLGIKEVGNPFSDIVNIWKEAK